MKRHTKPMPETVNSKRLKRVWKHCKIHIARSRDELYDVIWPFIRHWVAMLTDPDYPKDINYISMLNLLKVDTPDPIELVQTWVDSWGDVEDIEQELWDVLLRRLYYMKYVAETASDIMFEYVIARNFKQYFRHQIRKAQNHTLWRPAEPLKEISEEPWEYRDSIYLTDYERYIVESIEAGASTSDIHIDQELLCR